MVDHLGWFDINFSDLNDLVHHRKYRQKVHSVAYKSVIPRSQAARQMGSWKSGIDYFDHEKEDVLALKASFFTLLRNNTKPRALIIS